MSKILITGGAGYIGTHIAVALMQMGHCVVLYDNLSNSSPKALERLNLVAGRAVPFINGDVCDSACLLDALVSQEIDAVIHCAGLKAVGESVHNPMNYYANNVQGAISLLQAMKGAGVKTLVFSSSATVYGEPKYMPLDENHPIHATNPYGRTKVHIEEMLNDISSSDDEWRIVCLRYFNPVGAHESGLIGECPLGLPNNLMPYVAQVAAREQPYLKVFGDDYPTIDGTGVRDYIHVMDLADGHAAALNFLDEAAGWYAVNLGTGRGYSVLEIVNTFEASTGQKVPYKIVQRRRGDVAACYANPQKAARLLNWYARRSLTDMCVSTWNFHRFHRINRPT